MSDTIKIIVSRINNITNIPNYFSPNIDGVNDYFDFNALKYENIKLIVYNRRGNAVYRSIGYYKNDWDGTHQINNIPLPDGTYFYFVEIEEDL